MWVRLMNNIQLRGTSAVSVSNFPATQPISIATPPASRTDAIFNSTSSLTPKFKSFNAVAAGDLEVVAAVTGKKIRVLAYTMSATVALAVQWKSAATVISGSVMLALGIPLSTGYCPVGLIETASGEALKLNVGVAVGAAAGGHVVYIEV